MRSTLAQAGVVREALERGARSGRAVLDEALGDAVTERRRTAALAELGQIVFELVQQGELDLAELPEIHEVVERLERFEAEGEAAPRPRRTSRRSEAASMPLPQDEDEPAPDEDEPFLLGRARGEEEETFVGSRRRTIPLPRREPFGREFSARQERQQAVTQRMRATQPPPAYDEVEDTPLFEDEGDEASFALRVAAARDAVDGTVPASSWRPPAPRQESKVWRPTAAARAESSEASDLDRAPTARLRPARATAPGQPAAEATSAQSDAPATARSIDMPLAELHTVEDAAPPVSPRQDALTALTERSPFGAGKGGISFDDDLEEYMHPDDLPSKSRA